MRGCQQQPVRPRTGFFPYLVEIDVLKLYNTFKIYLPRALIVKVVVSKNIYFLFLQVIKYCSVPDVSINKLSTFIGNHVRHRILPDHHHFE